MDNTINESLCPFCDGHNKCMAHCEEPCWCFDLKIPNELLNLVPEDKKRKACICNQCIQNFNADPLGFIKANVQSITD